MTETREIDTFMWEPQPEEKKKPRKKKKAAAPAADVLEEDGGKTDDAAAGPGLFEQIKGLIDPLSERIGKVEGQVGRLTRVDDDDDDETTSS